MKASRDLWVLLTLIALFAIASVFTVQTTIGPEQDRILPRRTTYSASASGAKAAYLLLQRLGFQPVRWRSPLYGFPSETKVILIVDPLPNMLLTGRENLALDNWILRGGTLVTYNGYARLMPGQEDLTVKQVEHGQFRVRPPSQTGCFRGVKQLRARSGVRIQPDLSEAEYVPLVRDPHGVIMAVRRKGKGSAVAISAPNLVTNSGIGQADNAVLFVNLVAATARKGDLVLFDEYHQGYATGRTLGQVVGRYGRMAGLQLLAVFVIALYSYGRRFGAVRPSGPPAGRVGFEYVQAMARVYRRAQARSVALNMLFTALRRDVIVRLGLPDDAGLDRMVHAASAAWGIDANELADLLLRCDQVTRGGSSVSDAEMLGLSAEIQRFRKAAGIDR